MAYDVTITGFNKNEEVIFSIDANWISGFHLVSDKRFKEFEVNPGYLDMSASLSIDEMKEFHKENDSKSGRSTFKEEIKSILVLLLIFLNGNRLNLASINTT